MDSEVLKINEIFYSIQGESTKAGLPCVFVRLTYCNIRCVYCDTEYAFYEGVDRTIDDIVDEVKSFGCKLVEITGGEPLVQENVHILMKRLCDLGHEVLIETGGSLPIENIDKRVKIIMDLKTPYSKMEKKNRYENIQYLKPTDEVKFVIGSREDYDWVKEILVKYDIAKRVEQVLLSPVFDKVDNIELAEWILKDKLNVRFQLQMHKYIWHPETRGV
ncbi:MAG TPA: 7-carboxy-7-deazaguanine synthase QueE [Ignavibacteria bacterium]|nr:7-carboxy-7-deazaguanine synthase QueE [Ignavibacteria bacterium]HMR00004.1 7-carboxy-7-deazaguanine synthase QueE [Ignavibacteria bacterium]